MTSASRSITLFQSILLSSYDKTLGRQHLTIPPRSFLFVLGKTKGLLLVNKSTPDHLLNDADLSAEAPPRYFPLARRFSPSQGCTCFTIFAGGRVLDLAYRSRFYIATLSSTHLPEAPTHRHVGLVVRRPNRPTTKRCAQESHSGSTATARYVTEAGEISGDANEPAG